jgi:glucokinase
MRPSLYFVGVDVGGTTIKGGVVDEAGKALSSVNVDTEAWRGQDEGLRRMAEAARASIAAAKLRLDQIAAIGVATPGTMDIPKGLMLDPPNLKPWKNVPVRQYIEDTFHLPTAFQNDANAAAYGEYWVGAGKDAHSMVLFTLGTGIGGGIIINHMVLQGEHSHGAEVGHSRIAFDSARLCGCGNHGCLEAYASATAVVKRTEEALAEPGARSSLRAAIEQQELTARLVFEQAAAGDALARKIVDDTAYYLAIGATNLMHIIDPEMVVFAGGMVAAGAPFLDKIRGYVHKLALPVPAAKTQIRFAELGGDAGFIGAAGCARQLVQRGGAVQAL